MGGWRSLSAPRARGTSAPSTPRVPSAARSGRPPRRSPRPSRAAGSRARALVFGVVAVSVSAQACGKETIAQPYGAPPTSGRRRAAHGDHRAAVRRGAHAGPGPTGPAGPDRTRALRGFGSRPGRRGGRDFSSERRRGGFFLGAEEGRLLLGARRGRLLLGAKRRGGFARSQLGARPEGRGREEPWSDQLKARRGGLALGVAPTAGGPRSPGPRAPLYRTAREDQALGNRTPRPARAARRGPGRERAVRGPFAFAFVLPFQRNT